MGEATIAVVDADGDAKLKQFEVLWAEIARRSTAQQTLVGASVTVTGTVSGLVVTGKSSAVLLVVLAVVAPVFGLLWLDHAQVIGQIASFISSEWIWKPNWESRFEVLKATRSARARYLVFVVAIGIVFLAPALSGLAASVAHLHGKAGRELAWACAVGLTGLFASSWLVWAVKNWKR